MPGPHGFAVFAFGFAGPCPSSRSVSVGSSIVRLRAGRSWADICTHRASNRTEAQGLCFTIVFAQQATQRQEKSSCGCEPVHTWRGLTAVVSTQHVAVLRLVVREVRLPCGKAHSVRPAANSGPISRNNSPIIFNARRSWATEAIFWLVLLARKFVAASCRIACRDGIVAASARLRRSAP